MEISSMDMPNLISMVKVTGVGQQASKIPVWRAVFFLSWFLQRNIYQDLTILPSHHPKVDRVNAMFLNVLVNAQLSQNSGRIGCDLDT
jgi:hypothetical protein